jgi:hypothetical protein
VDALESPAVPVDEPGAEEERMEPEAASRAAPRPDDLTRPPALPVPSSLRGLALLSLNL